MASVVMVQGVRAGVGKTKFTAAISQYAARSRRTAVHKPLAMDDSFVALPDGGRAPKQLVLAARAVGQPVTSDLCPVTLQRTYVSGPVIDNFSVEGVYRLHVRGEYRGDLTLSEFLAAQDEFWPHILRAAQRLRDSAEVLVVEGVGGVGEADPRVPDLGNTRLALALDARVQLIADMLGGGTYADVHGVLAAMPPAARKLVRAVLVNKSLSDADRDLVASGLRRLGEVAGVAVLGPVRFFEKRSPRIGHDESLTANLDDWRAYYDEWISHMLQQVGPDAFAAALRLAGREPLAR